MADLKKLASIEIGKPGKGKYPTKKSINLLYKDTDTTGNIFAIVAFAIFMVLLAFFTKYMVIDQLAKVYAAEAAYENKQQELNDLIRQNEQYADIQSEYAHYGTGYLSQEELSLHDRQDVLDVINTELGKTNGINSITLDENTATVTIESVNMKEVSDLVTALNNNKNVSNVQVFTAGTGKESGDKAGLVTAEVTIYFTSPVDMAAEELEEDEPSIADQLQQQTEDFNNAGEGLE